MTPKSTFKLILLFFLFFQSNAFSQGCENADFSEGNFNYWSAFTGFCCGDPISTPGVVSGRHTIISSSYLDPLTNNTISSMPPTGGGVYTVKLGNENVGSEAERLRKTFVVTNDTRLFIYQYALVLQDPDGHTPLEKPKFEVKIYDQLGNIVNPYECGYYQVTAGPETDTWGVNGDIRYKDWSTVGLDLSAYIGTAVTVEFTVQDCGLGGHFGYAYIDAACGFLDIKVIGYCEGSNTVTLIAPDGFANYFWPHSGETTQTVVIPTPTIGDSIVVNVTNETGCSTSVLHVFEELPLPYANAGNDTTICVGTKINLWAEGGGVNGQYNWTANTGAIVEDIDTIFVMPLETTLYTVYVANGNGCYSPDSSATVNVIVDNTLLFELPDDTTICSTDVLSLTCSVSGVTYNWSSSQGGVFANVPTINVSPLISTTYYLEISNGSCTYLDSTVVTVQGSEYYDDTIVTPFCEGTTEITIIGPSIGEMFVWSGIDGDFFTVIDPTTSPTINLIYTTFFGCVDTVTYIQTLQNNPIPMISSIPDTSCFATIVDLSVSSTITAYYTWTSIPAGYSGVGPSVTDQPTQNISYIVQATTYNGCTGPNSFDTISIVIDSSAYFDLDPITTICEGNSTLLSALNTNGTLTWVTNGISIDNTSSVTVSPVIDQFYYLTEELGNCIYTDQIEVLVNHPITSSHVNDVCATSTSTVLFAPSSGYVSYFWPTFSNSSASNVLNNPTEGQIIPIYCTNNNGCSDTINRVIHLVAPSLISPLLDSTICLGEDVNLTAISTGSADIYTWTLSPVGYLGTGNTLTDTPIVTTTYVVTISNILNCVGSPNSQNATITVEQPQLVDNPVLISICPNDSVHISDSGILGVTNWSFQNVITAGTELDIIPNSSGDAVFTVNYGSCLNTYTTQIVVNQPTFYQISCYPNSPICAGVEVQLSFSPISYTSATWSTSSTILGSGANITVTPTATTLYETNLVDPNNCPATASFNVVVNDNPIVDLGEDQIICNTNTAILTTGGTNPLANYLWSTNETTNSITVNTSGVYSTNCNLNNCFDSDSVTITFLNPSFIGEIPNIITNNGDGKNDVFHFDYSNLLNFELVIVNRWGEKVFVSNDPSNYWNGTQNGNKVVDGVYFYMLKFENQCGAEGITNLNGNISVFGHL